LPRVSPIAHTAYYVVERFMALVTRKQVVENRTTASVAKDL